MTTPDESRAAVLAEEEDDAFVREQVYQAINADGPDALERVSERLITRIRSLTQALADTRRENKRIAALDEAVASLMGELRDEMARSEAAEKALADTREQLRLANIDAANEAAEHADTRSRLEHAQWDATTEKNVSRIFEQEAWEQRDRADKIEAELADTRGLLREAENKNTELNAALLDVGSRLTGAHHDAMRRAYDAYMALKHVRAQLAREIAGTHGAQRAAHLTVLIDYIDAALRTTSEGEKGKRDG